ncbi:MAG: hypothetical protein JWQ96_3525 [Segetibacter sp.]|nr:hypothetical protein [Segetibacter sp.]
MTVVVPNDLKKKEVQALLEKVKKKQKTFNAKKYFGKAKITSHPLKVQQEMRDGNNETLLLDTNTIMNLIKGDATVLQIVDKRPVAINFITEI